MNNFLEEKPKIRKIEKLPIFLDFIQEFLVIRILPSIRRGLGCVVKMPRQGGRGRRRKFADDGWTDSEDESTTQDEDTEGPSPSKRVKGAVTKAPSTGTAHFKKIVT